MDCGYAVLSIKWSLTDQIPGKLSRRSTTKKETIHQPLESFRGSGVLGLLQKLPQSRHVRQQPYSKKERGGPRAIRTSGPLARPLRPLGQKTSGGTGGGGSAEA